MARRAAADNVLKLTRPMLARLTLEPGKGERILWDSEMVGLGYRLRGERATWVVRPPRDGGRSSLITLSAADVLDITEARKAARERLAQVALGSDPRADRRKKEPAAITVAEAFERYTRDAEHRHRASTFANLKTHLRTHFACLHDKALVSVTRADVAAALRLISAESGPQASLRARRTLSTVYGWCIGEGITEHNPVVGTNAPAAEVRRDRVLSPQELVSVWNACPATDDFGRIVRLLVLTGQRRDEVAGIRWSEIDLAAGLWSLPATRTKNGRPHSVPLSPAAIAILAETPRIVRRDLAFGSAIGPFSGFSKGKSRLDAKVKLTPWRLHDLRRTAATGMAEIGVMPHIIESVLNHVSGHKAGVAGIYNWATYAPETRDALIRWSEHVVALVRKTNADAVTEKNQVAEPVA